MENTMLYNVPLALWEFVKSIFNYEPVRKPYVSNVFYNFDILMNTLTGGNWRITISARTGFYNKHRSARHGYSRKFWALVASIVDYTFYPMDGPGHCEQAYIWARDNVLDGNADEIGFMHGPKWSLVILLCVIILGCIPLIPILKIGKLLKLY